MGSKYLSYTQNMEDYHLSLAFVDVDVEAVQRAHRAPVRRPEGEVDVAPLDIRLHAAESVP